MQTARPATSAIAAVPAPPAVDSPGDGTKSSRALATCLVVGLLLVVGAGALLAAGLIIVLLLPHPDSLQKEPPYSEPNIDLPPVKPRPHPRQAEIEQAIRRGVEHLKKRLKEPNGTAGPDTYGRFPESVPLGRSALAALALLEARVPATDPAIQKALNDVRAGGHSLEMIYALGAVLFFLNRLEDENPALLTAQDRELRDTLTFRVVAGQQSDGRWSYSNPGITPAAQKKLRHRLESNAYKPAPAVTQAPSRSMTQFALLSLWGSLRHKLPVRPALLAAAHSFHDTQYPDGSWDYNVAFGQGKILSDSNTCAGLMALAMEKVLRAEARRQGKSAGDPPANPRADEQRDKAFAYLAKIIRSKGRFQLTEASLTSLRQDGVPEPVLKKLGALKDTEFPGHAALMKKLAKLLDAKELELHQMRVLKHTRKKSPGVMTQFTGTLIQADAWGDCYFLWCMERVAVIYGKNTIGSEDWYSWGVDILLANQNKDGSWSDRHGDVADTCFALLFLTRANLAKDLTDKLRELMGLTTAAPQRPRQEGKE
jgi:hypothetical protein